MSVILPRAWLLGPDGLVWVFQKRLSLYWIVAKKKKKASSVNRIFSQKHHAGETCQIRWTHVNGLQWLKTTLGQLRTAKIWREKWLADHAKLANNSRQYIYELTSCKTQNKENKRFETDIYMWNVLTQKINWILLSESGASSPRDTSTKNTSIRTCTSGLKL